MRIGYVHAGAPTHGVSRYGRLIAAEAACRPDVQVIECEVDFDRPPQSHRTQVIEAAQRLADVDVVHLQYNSQRDGSVWGAAWRQFLNLRRFMRKVGRPVVVTLHDVYGVRPVLRLTTPVRTLRSVYRSGPALLTIRWLLSHAAELLVCTREEERRLAGRPRQVRLIPHFVEARTFDISRSEAKDRLGMTGRRVITLLGYIHGRKGHRLVVEALRHLPENVVAVFAGAPVASDPAIGERLLALAASQGVGGRVFITGYLTEAQLEVYLIATDVAVCPFVRVSASGSLSTWISAARPIVASDLPQMREYDLLERGAIATFEPYTPRALAEAVLDALRRQDGEADGKVARLRDRLLLPAIVDTHVEVYRDLLRRTAGDTAVGELVAPS